MNILVLISFRLISFPIINLFTSFRERRRLFRRDVIHPLSLGVRVRASHGANQPAADGGGDGVGVGRVAHRARRDAVQRGWIRAVHLRVRVLGHTLGALPEGVTRPRESRTGGGISEARRERSQRRG